MLVVTRVKQDLIGRVHKPKVDGSSVLRLESRLRPWSGLDVPACRLPATSLQLLWPASMSWVGRLNTGSQGSVLVFDFFLAFIPFLVILVSSGIAEVLCLKSDINRSVIGSFAMFKRFRSPTIILAVTALLTTFANGEQLLRLNLEQGQRFYYRVAVSTQYGYWGHILPQTSNLEIDFDFIVDVIALHEDGSVHLRRTYDRIKFEGVDYHGQGHFFDSSIHDQPDISDDTIYALSMLVGASNDFVFDSQGRVIELPGLEQQRDQMLAKATSDQIRHFLSYCFDEDALLNQITALITPYPAHALSVGDTWSMSFPHPEYRNYTCDFSWEIERLTDEACQLNVSVAYKLTSDPPPDQTVSGGTVGSSIIDLQTGLTRKHESQTHLKIEYPQGYSYYIQNELLVTAEPVAE